MVAIDEERKKERKKERVKNIRVDGYKEEQNKLVGGGIARDKSFRGWGECFNL